MLLGLRAAPYPFPNMCVPRVCSSPPLVVLALYLSLSTPTHKLVVVVLRVLHGPGACSVILLCLKHVHLVPLQMRKEYLEKQPGADLPALEAAASKAAAAILDLTKEQAAAAAEESKENGRWGQTQPTIACDEGLVDELPRGLCPLVQKPMDMTALGGEGKGRDAGEGEGEGKMKVDESKLTKGMLKQLQKQKEQRDFQKQVLEGEGKARGNYVW